MSLLPAIVRGNAAAKLERAQAELDRAEEKRRDLQDQLAALDVESETYQAEAQALGAQISIAQKAMDILSLQIAGLEVKAAAEERAEQARRRDAAIVKIAKLLPQWPAAVEAYVHSLRTRDAARAALAATRKQIAKAWPSEIDLPLAFDFDDGRLTRAIDAADPGERDDVVAVVRETMAAVVDQLKEPKPDQEQAA